MGRDLDEPTWLVCKFSCKFWVLSHIGKMSVIHCLGIDPVADFLWTQEFTAPHHWINIHQGILSWWPEWSCSININIQFHTRYNGHDLDCVWIPITSSPPPTLSPLYGNNYLTIAPSHWLLLSYYLCSLSTQHQLTCLRWVLSIQKTQPNWHTDRPTI